ncbi:MAG: TatD family hydrolase, partial [Candidatus Omnitrophota bacterium]
VEYIINVGTDLKTSRSSLELAKKYPHIFAAVGVHPHSARDAGEETYKQIEALAGNKKVVAIGEVGLDFYRNLSPRDSQEQAFRGFIRLSQRLSLPLIIHSRNAQKETLSILNEEHYPGMKAVVHCFCGDKDFLQGCLNLGLHISFTANITYKKSCGLRECLMDVPRERLLLETDAPFLPPEGFRGQRNEPGMIKITAENIARIIEMDFMGLVKITGNNSHNVFTALGNTG